MTAYGKSFANWRDAAGPHWPAYTHHAFVEGLGDAHERTSRWQTLCDRFTTATRLEVGFWDTGLTQ